MKLYTALPGQVCRNVDNGSHYRYERPERGRVRIYPLELFPNGRLIPKPTPTIVSPDLEVMSVGFWVENMQVEGKPDHTRATYERQLADKRAELVRLEAAFLALPASGVGKLSRGSWANKLKNCRHRISTLELGLAELTEDQIQVVHADRVLPSFHRRDLIQLPSGRPGRIERVLGPQAEVLTYFGGTTMTAKIPVAALHPWSEARLATV